MGLKLHISEVAETTRLESLLLPTDQAALNRPTALLLRAPQSQKKNIDVFVKQINGVASILPEPLLSDCGLVIPQACCLLGFVNGLSHELDLVVHLGLR
jgi:hypothetical protein